jgi:hypothetical protein
MGDTAMGDTAMGDAAMGDGVSECKNRREAQMRF